MSILEKTIGLLENTSTKTEAIQSMLGIAHEYANLELIEQEEGAFERAIAGKYAIDK